jgi:hypothetical protein
MRRNVKEVVSRRAIKREIDKVRRKLIKLERARPLSADKRESIFRQLLQLELCDRILFDVHILWP